MWGASSTLEYHRKSVGHYTARLRPLAFNRQALVAYRKKLGRNLGATARAATGQDLMHAQTVVKDLRWVPTPLPTTPLARV